MATTATGTNPAQTGTMRTGMTGMRTPQQKPSLPGKIMQWWSGSTTKQKLILGSIVLAVALLIFSAVQYNKATAFVDLYENPLSAGDLADVTQALTQMGIPYSKTQDNHIVVPPSKRVEALVELTKDGIPKHPFDNMASSGSTGETHEQFTAEQQLMLERDLTLVLRQFNEIADADVKLVIPSETADFFSDQKQEAKAAVVLKLKPGYDNLPLNEARSIVSLVAYSVPGLKPANVQLTDTSGRLLSDMLKKAEDSTLPDNMIEEKQKYQKLYESQIKQILDPVLGHGKYALAVNVDLNWNQSESQTQTVGNPELNPKGYVTVEKQVTKEKFDKKNQGSSGMKQLGFSPYGSANPNGDAYVKSEKLEKNEINRSVTTSKVTPGQVVRITASVLADQNVSPSAQRTLAAEIKNAIGMDPDRGDSVAFGTLPFYQNEIARMTQDMSQPLGFRENAASPVSGAAGLRILEFLTAIGILIAAIYLYRQQKAKAAKAQLVLAAGPAATVSEISDLVNDKTGKVNVVQQGPRANQTEKLEQLAKEKPTKVAELLKTTWLAEK